MYNLDVEPIHWEPMPIKDHERWWSYGAMSKSTITVEGKTYGKILRIWSSASLHRTDQGLEPFYYQGESVYPDHDSVFGGTFQGTLAEMLNDADVEYREWVGIHQNRRFQLSAFCTMLNTLYALNHLGSEDAEEE